MAWKDDEKRRREQARKAAADQAPWKQEARASAAVYEAGRTDADKKHAKTMRQDTNEARRLRKELENRARTSVDKGVQGKLRRTGDFTVKGLTNEAVEKIIQGIPDEQTRAEAADIYGKLQSHERSGLLREFGRKSVSELKKPSEDAEWYAEYGGQTYDVTPTAAEPVKEEKPGILDQLRAVWEGLTGGGEPTPVEPAAMPSEATSSQAATPSEATPSEVAGPPRPVATPSEVTGPPKPGQVTPSEVAGPPKPAAAPSPRLVQPATPSEVAGPPKPVATPNETMYDTPAGPPKPEPEEGGGARSFGYDPEAYKRQLVIREAAAGEAYAASLQANTLACTEAVNALYEQGLSQYDINLQTYELEKRRDAANVQAKADWQAELEGIETERATLRNGADDVFESVARLADGTLDAFTNGQYSRTKGNKGFGFWDTVGMIAVSAGYGLRDATFGNAARLLDAYNEGVIHGTTWLVNKAAGTSLDADQITQSSLIDMGAGMYTEHLAQQQAAKNSFILDHASPGQAVTFALTEQTSRFLGQVMAGKALTAAALPAGGIQTASQIARAPEIAKVLQTMPLVTDVYGSSYAEKREEGKDVLGSTYYAAFSAALELATEADIVDNAIQATLPTTWLAKAGMSKNLQTSSGRKLLDYVTNQIVAEPTKEGIQEVISYVGGELGGYAIFGDDIELSAEEAAANFLGGFAQRVLLSASSLPAYTKSNQMLRERAQMGGPANLLELTQAVREDLQDPNVQAAVERDVLEVMTDEASMTIALNGGVDTTQAQAIMETAQETERAAEDAQAKADSAAQTAGAAAQARQEITAQIISGEGDMKALGDAVTKAGKQEAAARAQAQSLQAKAENLRETAEAMKSKSHADIEAQMAAARAQGRQIAEQALEEIQMDTATSQGGVEAAYKGRSLRAPIVQRYISDVGKTTGTAVEFAALPEGDEGYYDRTAGHMVLSDNLDGASAIKAVTMHELAHSIEGTARYAQYADLALKAAYGTDSAAMQADMQEVVNRYAERGIALDEAGARAELVAQATRNVIYADEAMIDRLVRTDRNFVQRVVDSIRDFVRGLGARRNDPAYADIRKAQKLFEKALSEKTPGEGEQHSIEQDDKGYYVKADRKVVLSDDPKRWNDEIQRYIQDTIRKNGDVTIQTIDGDTLRITKDSQWHAGSRGKNHSQELYRTKLNASAHLDEVATVSKDQGKNRPNKPDDGRHRALASKGWRYREAMFEDYDGKLYRLTISVAQNKEGETVYNIGRVEPTQKNRSFSVSGPRRNESFIVRASADADAGAPTEVGARELNGSNNSITEEASAVNSYSTQDGKKYSVGRRQFGSKTAQTIEDIPERIRQLLKETSDYETDTNDAQIIRAENAYREMGAEEAAAEVLSREGALSADDEALAQVTAAHAVQDGELLLAAQLLDRYNVEGTKIGQALQARKIMGRLTVQGALAEATKRVEGYNQKALSGMSDKSRKADIKKTVERVQQALPAGPEIRTDGGNNRWRVPLNDAQRALIREYKLDGVSLPGIHYNRATVEQRMLAAILATPGISRGYGHLNLVEQLEYMRRGYAVTTEADLNYIASQMQEFMDQSQAAGEDGKSFEAVTSREAKLALARAYEAAGNTIPVSRGEKFTGALYMNMLQRPVTAIKNVLSNVFTRPLEQTSTAVASLIDQAVARSTGERTTGTITRDEARAARKAFAQEVANTYADYFVDRADTSHGAKYAVGAKGRTYQTKWLEAAKALVDFTMQIGDRPFYEQCYAEELAVLRRLNPDIDADAARKEATARALERVFQEDNAVTSGLSRIAQGKFGFAVKLLIPFAKTPTNVVTRMAQYSPVGLADAMIFKGWYASHSKNGAFNQRDFVMGVGRGLTGSGLMLAGMLLGASGIIKFGRGDEDDQDKAALLQADGVPYSAYVVDWNGNQHEIEWALPMVGPLVLGASFGKRIENDEALWAATIGGLCDMGDQLFDNSFMQSLTGVLKGNSESATMDIGVGLASSLMGMLVPGNVRGLAKAFDPYVRDTSAPGGYDDPMTALHKAFNQSIISALPGLRQTLPVKVDVTGQPMSQNAAYDGVMHFLDSFFTPTATLSRRNDPVLTELLEIADRTGDGSWLPGNVLYGTRYDLTVPKTYAKNLRLNRGEESYAFTLTPEERAEFNQDFGRLLFDGGTTLNNKGGKEPVKGLRNLMESREWTRLDDVERIEKVKEMASLCKAGVTYEWAKFKRKEE